MQLTLNEVSVSKEFVDVNVDDLKHKSEEIVIRRLIPELCQNVSEPICQNIRFFYVS